MSYVWSNEGPAFMFPTCYRTENRFLTLRAAALFVLALAILWVVLADPEPVLSGPALLRPEVGRGSSTPHVLLAMLLLVLAVVDLVRAALHRRVHLAPGQPASLIPDLSRQSTGTSTRVDWMMQLVDRGSVPAPELDGRYRRPLLAAARDIASAPSSLQDYLRVRLAHLLFAGGLLVALALTWVLLPRSAALPLAALLYAALATALVARSAWISKAAPSPSALLVVLALAAVGGVLVAWLAGGVPRIDRLQRLALPGAAAVLLITMALIEWLCLMAARAQVDRPAAGDVSAAEAGADLVAEPGRLMQEVERELHRYWAEGIPNRRHVWEPPAPDEPGSGTVVATVLEETQPLLQADNRRERSSAPLLRGRVWLWLLLGLGLLLTLIGGAAWVWLAVTHMKDLEASWASAASALVLVVAGGYALRAGHLLWSRFEVDSLLLWLEFRSLPAARPDVEPAGASRLRLRVRTVRLRTVFYAGAEHPLGSRTVLGVAGDEAAARRFVKQVQGYAERLPRAAAAPARERPVAPAAAGGHAAAPAVTPAPARFCGNCGAAVLQGARFCHSCGHPLPAP